MKPQKTTGIVLKKFPYGDKDLIVVWLTDKGRKMTGFAPQARQSKKRFGGELDLFNHLEFNYREGKNSDMVRLDGVGLLTGMIGLRDDLSKFAAACYFAEMILEFLQEKQAVSPIFDTYFRFLKGMSDSKDFKTHLIPLFEHEFLSLFGFKPFLTECISCQKQPSSHEKYFFDGRKGGVVCPTCCQPQLTRTEINLKGDKYLSPADAYPLSFDVIHHIVRAHQADPQSWASLSLSQEDIREARNAFEYFIQYTAGKPFKTLRFLSQILN